MTIREGWTRLCTIGCGLESIVHGAMSVPGWVALPAAREIAIRSYRLRGDPVIVEVGAFMGRSSALLAGARRRRGSGRVHAVDPFDCSGDDFSVPHYRRLLDESGATTLEGAFQNHMRRLGLDAWVEAHVGTAAGVAAGWDRPIDLLLLDGDQSPAAARQSYDLWTPFLKRGGWLIMNNAGERDYAEGHDGYHRVATNDVQLPRYGDRRTVRYTLFACKR